jgi:ERCC4 domain-containing protein/Lsr2 protein
VIVPDDFVIARNPDPESRLPYLLRIPLGPGVLVKARDTWPRTQAVYCHASDGWPDHPEIIERIPVRTCSRRGAAIDLVLDRGRENRSQFVFTSARGRQVIFWQTARVARAARPAVRIPTASRLAVPIIVDDQEKYPYRFTGQRLSTERRRLPAGDYAVEMDGRVVASVERKTLPDLVSSLVSGRLGYAMADLAALPRAAIVVEERYSRLFKQEHVRGAVAADALTEAQVRWPSVPIVFCETRRLAEDWTHRFLMAALSEIGGLELTGERERALSPAPRLERRPPTTREIRQWAQAAGLPVADRGGLRSEVVDAYRAAHDAAE